MISFLPQAKATEIFSDGFESGDFSAWDTTSGAPAVSSGGAHHGTYKAEFNANAEYTQEEFSQGTTPIYHRFYFQVNALPASSGETCSLGSIELYVAGYSAIRVMLYHDGSSVVFRAEYRDSGAYVYQNSDEVSPVINTWYCLEMKVNEGSGSSAEWRVWLDGTPLNDLSRDGDMTYDMRYIRVGTEELDYTATMLADCVVVADAYIGVESEGQNIIADLSETLAVESALSTQKNLYRSSSETLVIEESSTTTKHLYRTNAESTEATTIIETQKDIGVTMLVEISQEVIINSALYTTKHIAATLVELSETVNLTAILYTSLIVELTTNDLMGLIIVFFIIAVSLAVAALGLTLKKKH